MCPCVLCSREKWGLGVTQSSFDTFSLSWVALGTLGKLISPHLPLLIGGWNCQGSRDFAWGQAFWLAIGQPRSYCRRGTNVCFCRTEPWAWGTWDITCSCSYWNRPQKESGHGPAGITTRFWLLCLRAMQMADGNVPFWLRVEPKGMRLKVPFF